MLHPCKNHHHRSDHQKHRCCHCCHHHDHRHQHHHHHHHRAIGSRSPQKSSKLILRVILLICIHLICIFSSANGQFCSTTASSDPKEWSRVVEPDSDVQIAVLLNAHERGSRGIYDCGNVSREGLIAFESLEWLIGLINQDEGIINGDTIRESFVPGVKLGAKIFDGCYHLDVSVQQLADIYPALKSGTESCSSSRNNSQLATVGVLDLAQISVNPKINEYARRNFIPIVPLSLTSVIPPDTAGKILGQIIHDLEWTQIAVVHETDEHSVHIVKLLGQISMTNRICLTAVESLPELDSSSGSYASSVHFSSASSPELRAYALIYNAITAQLKENMPIIVIGRGESVKRLAEVIIENSEVSARFQWLFSSLPEPEVIKALADKLSNRIFTLAPYPGTISMLEDFWQQLQKLDSSGTNPQSLTWFDEYVQHAKGCQRDKCINKLLAETSVDILWRTHHAYPLIHAVFTFAHALKDAWFKLCDGKPGFCAKLSKLSRKEFVSTYLEPFEFAHNVTSRSPPEVTGRKSELTRAGEIEGIRLAVTKFEKKSNSPISYHQLIVYDTASNEAKVIDTDFEFKSSPCPLGGCRKCVKIRQSRLDENRSSSSSSSSSSRREPTGSSVDNDIETLGSALLAEKASPDIVIPIIIPVHRSGKSSLDCSKQISSEAIYDLEAALWMIDQINGDKEFVPGLTFGYYPIDSCSSSVKLVERVSKYLTSQVHPILGAVPLESALSFITSLPPEEAKAAAQLLKPLNISLISARDLTTTGLNLGSEFNLLQTALPYEQFVYAAVEQLKYFGWSYVSVVISDSNAESLALFNAFRTAAGESGICIAVRAVIDEKYPEASSQNALMSLKSAKESGAKAVVLMTDLDSTRTLMASFRKALKTGGFRKDDFVWLVVRESNLNFVSGFENEAGGSLLLREAQGSITVFLEHFSRLRPESNGRNPWFKDFWLQTTDCNHSDCLVHQMNPVSVVNVMQSVLALISGFARLRSEICGTEVGLCGKLQSRFDTRNRLSHYVQSTAAAFTSPASKDTGEMLSFTAEGYGAKQIDILNFKKDASNGFYRFDQVAHYNPTFSKMKDRSYVSYDAANNEIPMEKLLSECAFPDVCESKCHTNSVEFLYTPSQDELFITAAMSVREPSKSSPLQCGPASTVEGIQKVEAFLWALDTLNSHPSILPGVRLGGLILDTCSSHQKAARDVSNFLSDANKDADSHSKLPTPKSSFGFMVDSDDIKILDSVIDLAMPLDITTIGSNARNSKYDDVQDFPKLLRMSISNQVYADSLISILLQFGWSYVSVLYQDDGGSLLDTFVQFKIKSEIVGIELAVEEKIQQNGGPNFMISIIHRLRRKAKLGSKVVVLFLDSDHISYLLAGVRKLQAENEMKLNEFVWIAVDGKEAFHSFPEESLGAISVMTPSTNVASFKTYLSNLDIRNNTRNPWFRDYWEKLHNCRGTSCFASVSRKMMEKVTVKEREIVATINSVFALGHGLELVRRTLCPHSANGICQEMKDHPKFGDLLYSQMKKSVFIGADGKKVQFTEGANYVRKSINVYNFRHVSANAVAFITVGRFNENDALSINISKAVAYGDNLQEVSFRDVISRCLDAQKCSNPLIGLHKAGSPSVLQIPPAHSLTIGALLPVHKAGGSYFTCGEIDTKRMFQNLIAFNFAIDRINKNKTLLKGTSVGALVIDYCSRKERAEEKLFTYFAGTNLETTKIPHKTLVAMITYSGAVGAEIEPLLTAHKITHLTVPASEEQSEESQTTLQSVPSKINQINAMIDLLLKMDWKYVFVIYDNEEARRQVKRKAAEAKVCIEDEINASEVENSANSKGLGQSLTDRLRLKDEAKVVLMVTNFENGRSVISALNSDQIKKLIWVGDENLLEILDDHKVPVRSIAVRTESYVDEDFKKYFKSLTLGNHASVPMPWFEEFWQLYFKCQLPNSIVAQVQFSNVCTGEERLDSTNLIQDEYVSHTISSVLAVAGGLENYLQKHCVPGNLLNSIDDCADNAREVLAGEIRAAFLDGSVDATAKVSTPPTPFGFHILERLSGSGPFSIVGLWKNGDLKVTSKDALRDKIGSSFKSHCLTKCSKCWKQFRSEQLVGERPVLTKNFKRTWGVVTATLSGLGVLAVLICGFYFLMVFPVTVGTTVLGYLILLGLLFLYLVNFAFLVPANFPICWLRRFGMAIAYSMVLSGMLIKVMNTWRLMAYKNMRPEDLKLTSACGLMMVSGGLVLMQVIITVAWLFMFPPQPGFYSGVWQCSAEGLHLIVETESSASLLYILILLVITMFFCALTWRSFDNNREPRYILVCCGAISATWVTWCVLSSSISSSFFPREMTVICVNLLNGTVIMLFMYMRKLCIYIKLSRQSQNEREYKARLKPSTFPGSLYGTVHKTNPIVWEGEHHVYGRSASNTLRGATRKPFESDQIDDGASSCGSTTGSVQVQAQDLYPMEVYDGGSQFQAMSSLFNGNSNRSVYLMDESTYIR